MLGGWGRQRWGRAHSCGSRRSACGHYQSKVSTLLHQLVLTQKEETGDRHRSISGRFMLTHTHTTTHTHTHTPVHVWKIFSSTLAALIHRSEAVVLPVGFGYVCVCLFVFLKLFCCEVQASLRAARTSPPIVLLLVCSWRLNLGPSEPEPPAPVVSCGRRASV